MLTTETIWTDFARSYDRVLRHWDPYLTLVASARRHLAGARRILEMGCGTGIVAQALADEGAEVDAIDNNEAMLDVARQVALRLPLIRPILGDALFTPFESNTFDGLVSNNVIFYVDDPIQLLREARRVLRPGATMVISGPKPEPDVNMLISLAQSEFHRKGLYPRMRDDVEHFFACSRMLKKEGMPNVYTLPQIVDLLKNHGFPDVIESSDAIYYSQSWFVAVR